MRTERQQPPERPELCLFTHSLLRRPIGDLEQIDLITALALFRAEQPLVHDYDGRQSTGGDQRLVKGGRLGTKYRGRTA